MVDLYFAGSDSPEMGKCHAPLPTSSKTEQIFSECTRTGAHTGASITHKRGWLHRSDTVLSHGAHPTSICFVA